MGWIAARCLGRSGQVVALWMIAALVGILGFAVGGVRYTNNLSLPGTDSQQAIDLVQREFPALVAQSDMIVLHARSGTLRDPATRAQAEALVARVAKLPKVKAVQDPFAPTSVGLISPDGRTAVAVAVVDVPVGGAPPAGVQAAVRAAGSSTLEVEVRGQGVSPLAAGLKKLPLVIALGISAVIIYIAVGSLAAVGIALAAVFVPLVVAEAAIGLASQAATLNVFAPLVAGILGLGAGLGGALFVVARYRGSLRAGLAPEEAVVVALTTAGRAVVQAGATAVPAVLALLLFRLGFLSELAVASAVAIVAAVAGVVTLLPALLHLFRARLGASPGVPDMLPDPAPRPGFFRRDAHRVDRLPLQVTAIALVAAALLAAPLAMLRFAGSDDGVESTSTSARRAFDLLTPAFGADFTGPLLLAVQSPAPLDSKTMLRLALAAGKTPGAGIAIPDGISADERVGVILVYGRTRPQSAATTALIHRLRTSTLPAATAGTALSVHVGGAAATFYDMESSFRAHGAIVIVTVLGLSFLVMGVVLRSLLLPLTVSLLNLLVVATALGVSGAVFSSGRLASLFGVSSGPIDPIVLPILFVVLYVIGIGSHVFLVTRVSEERAFQLDDRAAIRAGHEEAARASFAASSVLQTLFFSIVFQDSRLLKLIGFALAVGLTVDALIIRTKLAPALMHIHGRASWWLPPALDRALPRLRSSVHDLDVRRVPSRHSSRRHRAPVVLIPRQGDRPSAGPARATPPPTGGRRRRRPAERSDRAQR